MIKHYLSIAFRNLLRNKVQTLFTIVGLAVSFFCFGICMYYVNGFRTVDSYYENHDRVMELWTGHHYPSIRSHMFDGLQDKFPEIESVFRLQTESHTYHNERLDQNYELITIECDTTLRHIYNPRLLAGSWHAAEHSTNSFVITERWARKLFGSPDAAIGEQFTAMGGKRFSGNISATPTYTVQAVVEDLPYNNTILPFGSLAAWVLNDTDGILHWVETENSEWIYFYNTRILLREGTDIDKFVAKVDAARILVWQYVVDNQGEVAEYLSVDPPFDIEREYNSYWLFALLMLIIAAPGLLILLSALSNFFHLLIGNIMMRRREYTLRRAHGAHTRDLWIMVSTQIVVTLVIVGFVTLLIVEFCAPLIDIKIDTISHYIFDTGEMMRQTLLHLGILLLIGFCVAWLAVARIRKDSLQEAMKTSTGRRPGRHIGRNILIGWQMFIGFLFITLLGALIMQIRTNEEAQIPWLSIQEKKDILFLPYGFSSESKAEIEAELRAIPSVKEVVALDYYTSGFEFPAWNGLKVLNEQGDTLQVSQTNIETNVLSFLHVPLLRGRLTERPDEVLIDQLIADYHHLDVGDQLDLLPEANNTRFLSTQENSDDQSTFIRYATIVGVIDNLMLKTSINGNGNNRMYQQGGIYFTHPVNNGSFCVKSYPGKVKELCHALNEHVRKMGMVIPKDYDMELESLYDYVRKRNSTMREFLALFWLFACIALIITLLGVYSAITVDTAARRKEMAIRKINGAKARHIALRFARFYIILLVITASIAFALTYILFYYVGEVAAREKFDTGFLFYGSIFLLMTTFVALTISVQVWRIAKDNPSMVVKSE